MQELGRKKGGKCLSTDYVNNKQKLKWQCKKGHVWEATPDTIKNKNRWCSKCS